MKNFWRLVIAVAVASVYANFSTAEDAPSPAVLAEQAAEYRAELPKTIVELQQFRTTESVAVHDPAFAQATLINLNPTINAWYLLLLSGGKSGNAAYHLENPSPATQTLRLATEGIEIVAGNDVSRCGLWSGGANSALEAAKRRGLPFAPLCNDRLYLRNRVAGNQTSLERVTDFLRDHVWGGDAIVSFVRQQVYSDAFIEQGTPGSDGAKTPPATQNAPKAATLDPKKSATATSPVDLDFKLRVPMRGLAAGQWYPLAGLDGVYFSFVQPQNIAPEILKSYRDRVNDLDGVEAGALDYLIAFDLSDFDLGFVLGTDHPRVNWSDRPRAEARGKLPGPDGIGTAAPVVTNGMLSPSLLTRAVATFTGGFKREHGAFRYGDFANLNHGSHYGFIEQGVIFSKLQPGLATLYVLDDGSLGMKSWREPDDTLLPRIRFARQNGVPLIDYDEAGKTARPGELVGRWGPGNWSGTAEEKLRSLRAGICFEETGARRFLIYGYFSSATPSAMARVFQAYGCRYAMHLDMNALEHTYLALYLRHGNDNVVEHLVQGMALIDKKSDDTIVPRFLGYPDDRDFFYLVRKKEAS